MACSSYQYNLTLVKNTHEVKFHTVYMHIPHTDKIPPKSATYCIRFQLFTVLSLTFVTILKILVQGNRFKQVLDLFFVLFGLIHYVPSTIFQLCRDGSSWVEPVLSWDKCVLLKDHSAVTLVRLEPAAPRSRVYH